MAKIFHVKTSDGSTYGVAASNKTEAKLFVQTRLTAEQRTDYPVTAECVGTEASWTYGNVLCYRTGHND